MNDNEQEAFIRSVDDSLKRLAKALEKLVAILEAEND